jgi:hypothetical protein
VRSTLVDLAQIENHCNAGHPYPILVSSGAVHTLDQGGAVLGVFPDWKYEESINNKRPGARRCRCLMNNSKSMRT